jgi:hypothetical protein
MGRHCVPVDVAIMQPTYLPWIGYFAMIDRADHFIYLDSVQYARRSWQQRNRIKTNGGEMLLTVPVFNTGLRDQAIRDVAIDHQSGFAKKHWRSIDLAYSKAPFFEACAAPIKRELLNSDRTLAEYNIALIESMCSLLSIATPRCRSSTMKSCGQKAELLARLCKEKKADRYIAAPGSRQYLEQSLDFHETGIEVVYHEYDHPQYEQGKRPFLSHMSAIDLIFRVGPERGLEVIRSGVVC